MARESLSGQSGWALTGLTPGSLVAGYRVESRIGAGGMAMVLRARDEALGRTVALKILPPALAGGTEFRERFVREARAVAAVDHPHIIPVYAAGEDDGVLYLAMRFVSGGDLRSLAQREGPLPGGRAVALLSPVASALDTAHAAGLVHRDVKPANILVDTSPGRPEHPYLSDFGLAKGAAASAGLTGTGQFLGTPDYSAPEQISGKPARGQTDQYALACVAYALLVGSPPFIRDESMAVLWAHMYDAPPSLTASRPDLPAFADRAIARALSKSPEDRYRTCGEFIDALRDSLGAASRAAAAPRQPHAASPQPTASQMQPQATVSRTQPPPGPAPAPAVAAATGELPIRRFRTYLTRRNGRQWPVVTTALVLLVLLVGGGGYGFWRYNQSQVYVGVEGGYVAVFRGTNQSMGGISLSSLIARSLLPVSQLGSSDRAEVTQTIAQDSVQDAEQLIDQLQGRVNVCRTAWQTDAAWPAADKRYQAEVANAKKSKGTVLVPASDNPGPGPSAPNAADCAAATAFGVKLPSS